MSDSQSSSASDAGSNASEGQRGDTGGSRSDYATNQHAADRLDSGGKGDSNSDAGTGGPASGQDAADKLDEIGSGQGAGSDYIPAAESAAAESSAGGGGSPSKSDDIYSDISEPYKNLPSGGPSWRTSELRPPPPGPPGGNDDNRKSKARPSDSTKNQGGTST